MTKFRITESAPATYYWHYIVEAETQEEAERMVVDGEVNAYDTHFDVEDDQVGIIEVEEDVEE